ncbi:hypothetical protein REPUB_Repub01dG0015500 [Reevesia pubescens]
MVQLIIFAIKDFLRYKGYKANVRNSHIRQIAWDPLLPNCVKLNVDGALSSAGEMSIDGICRAWVRGYRSLIVESDSREVVLKLLHPVLDTDPHFHIILNCHNFLNKDWQCSINHCFREANTCADFLAKSASSDVCYQFSSPEGRLLDLIRDDAFGVCRPRALSLLM